MHSCPPSPFLQSSLHSKCQSGVVALVHVVSSIGVVLEIVVNFDVLRSVVVRGGGVVVVCGVDGGWAGVVATDSDSLDSESETGDVVASDVDGRSYKCHKNGFH